MVGGRDRRNFDKNNAKKMRENHEREFESDEKTPAEKTEEARDLREDLIQEMRDKPNER